MNSTYYLNLVIGNVMGTKKTPALPDKYYIGLSATAPAKDGTGISEPSTVGTGYARVLLNNLSSPTNGVITNTGTVSFPESILAWGTMTHYVVYDAATGGNFLFSGALSESRIVQTKTVIGFKENCLKITLSDKEVTSEAA